ncbi:MAG: HAMP domain-containing protein, partial [Clostridia bacterium]|nr:HAMP domain-containing protein [Clostridia bacterium]
MDTKKLLKRKKWKNKTHSMQFRFLATVIFAMFAVTFFIGGLCLYEVDHYVQEQAENFVEVTCTNEAAQINGKLSNMEKSVKIMESYLMDFFTSKEDVEDPALQEKVIQSADQMFVDVAKHTSTGGAIAYYFRFDPAISDGKSGLFYSKLNGGDEFLSLEPTDITIYEKTDTEHVGWFWQPYEAGEPIWMKPYHNQNNNIMMISYVIPMYYEDKFIGIVGMDFDYIELANQVHSIKVYENGFAHLESDGIIVCEGEHGFMSSSDIDSKKYMNTSKDLVNGMTLVLSASYADIQQIRHDITYEILFVVGILSALFMVIAIIIVKRIVDPLNKLTDASVKLSNGDYDVEIADSNTREIKLLSTAFENMTMRLKEREELLLHLANRDSLTGLRNT